MRDADFPQFAELLDAVCGLLSRGAYTPNATNSALWFRALRAHDLDVVRAAFDAHVKDPQRGRFVPTPADILAQIAGQAAEDGRPGPEEAWAIAITARDEFATVVWTDETAKAWGIARPVMEAGDEVGARMAFREAYARLVDEARAKRQPVAWTVSDGFDQAGRVTAINAAVEAGRLPVSALPMLPAPRDGAPVALLGTDSGLPSDEQRAKLNGLIEAFRKPREIPVDTSERDRLNAAKRAADMLTREYAAQQGIDLDGSPIGHGSGREAKG